MTTFPTGSTMSASRSLAQSIIMITTITLHCLLMMPAPIDHASLTPVITCRFIPLHAAWARCHDPVQVHRRVSGLHGDPSECRNHPGGSACVTGFRARCLCCCRQSEHNSTRGESARMMKPFDISPHHLLLSDQLHDFTDVCFFLLIPAPIEQH